MLKIEAVTVCVGYADFLAETVKYNAGLVDRLIVVTTPDDHATREVCRRHSIQTLLSEDGSRTAPGDFAKGRLVERGLQHLSADGWRMHIDADVVLPNRFHQILDSAHLDERNIYGCDRIMVRSWDEWQRLQKSGWMPNDYHIRVNLQTGMPLGTRWADHGQGYCPIGFLQLWHSSEDQYRGVRNRPYPGNHNDACRTDVQFALQWDRKHRALLPELVVVHLESEPCVKGANWKGRKTRHFGPAGGSKCVPLTNSPRGY